MSQSRIECFSGDRSSEPSEAEARRRLSGEIASSLHVLPSFSSVTCPICVPFARSQSVARSVRKQLTAANVPSLAIAAATITRGRPPPAAGCANLPVATSQVVITLSLPTTLTLLPSAENARDFG